MHRFAMNTAHAPAPAGGGGGVRLEPSRPRAGRGAAGTSAARGAVPRPRVCHPLKPRRVSAS